ncbi:hypothetical protein GCM10009646_79190 [Streptomyces aureus]
MKRGRLKTTDLPIRVDEISSDVQRTLDGELEWGLSVKYRGQTVSGHEFATGQAALRKEVERDIARVGDEDGVTIRPTVSYNHVTEFGEWLAIGDGWLIVSDEWVAGVVSTQLSGHAKDANLDLQALLDEIDVQDVWQIGFSGRGVVEGGTKGVLYGRDVHEDPDLGEELRHTPLNELGIEHLHDGIPVKSYFAAGTGYIEVYDSEFTTEQFVEYVCLWVGDHVEGADNSSSSAEEDTDESSEDSEVRQCECCPRETESVKETFVDGEEYILLCVTCRDYYYENGEVPA